MGYYLVTGYVAVFMTLGFHGVVSYNVFVFVCRVLAWSADDVRFMSSPNTMHVGRLLTEMFAIKCLKVR